MSAIQISWLSTFHREALPVPTMENGISTITLTSKDDYSLQRNGKVLANPNSSIAQDIVEHITTVVHVLSVCLTIYILYLCFLSPFSLVTWHVFLYTIGWTLLMTEGILAIIKENVFTKRLKQPIRVQIHWITLLLATVLIIGGLATIVLNRARGDGNHFSTEHGISGIVATIFGFIAVINGVPTLYSAQIRRIISPNVNKLFHAFLGFATVIAGAYGTITGYYTGWFQNRSTDTLIIVCIIITVVLTVWSMIRPIINGFARARNLFN